MSTLQSSRDIEGISRRSVLVSVAGAVAAGLATGCGGGGGSGLNDNPRVLASPEGDEVILAGTDPSNPLSVYRWPITRRLSVLAHDLAQGTASFLHAIERFLSYIDGFAVGYASSGTPDATVLERVGACGSYTGVLLAMARCLGIPGRYVTLANYPVNDGHAVCELYLYGRWMLFDATTHVYYVDSDDLSGLPLAYEDVRARYSSGLPVFRVGQNARAGRDLYSGRDIYIHANPQGVIGPANPLRYPLRLDLVQKPVIAAIDFTAVNQGASYLGAASTNVQQDWALTSLQPGSSYRFVMEPHWMGGDYSLSDADLTFILTTELVGGICTNAPLSYFDFAPGLADPLIVEFVAQMPTVTLKLSHPYRGPAYRYVHALEYRLEVL